MVERSTYALLLVTTLVLMLSFKDLILIRSQESSPDDSKHAQQHHEHPHDQHGEHHEHHEHLHQHVHGDENGFEEDGGFDDGAGEAVKPGERDDELYEEKRIPSLKMMKGGTGNMQTLKFKFW